ncbi:MAG: tRNA (N(6)-L-threonylcarbamoyladenosine(37)-C(2))-methylthiotransferase MtaB [Lachnospiraceae bacterium]|nr:tRNA (N(6)-L-threonylcarbamoyladenosine(37)-C(2))-methylthiotransferase MtaB [uncultured Acetatifactor sp.]MCI8286635.1 tRNA (N(6)-L-threonylcarbamoyladenosine(37)-C(2))-methylthiotransferase MtaB [Lachnospiraceae bacterium]
MKNVALYNLGCKVNSYETDGMRQMLEESGYRIVAFDGQADIYIVNTCTVTNIADRKSRQMLHRAKQMNPDAVVVAVGCYVQTGREAVEKDESIDLAVGNNRKKDIVKILETFLADRQDKTLQGKTIPEIGNIRKYEEMQLRQTSEHTRAYIKVQDGCNQFCSYCAIPYARGRVRSRRAEDVLREVRGMTEAGYREVVLTGIHLSSYGIDFESEADYNGSSCLLDLTEKLHEIPGLERIRLGSLEPRIITSEAAERMAAMPKLCPHFHLSLQSGCDDTLKRMNRHYTAGEYYNSVEILRKHFANPAVTTDVITGFPGETEEEFRQTRKFLEKVCFYEIHVFKYSRRAGTAAAAMQAQVPEQVKASRSKELLELTARQSVQFRSGYIGREAEVLLEEKREIAGRVYLVGHTKDYVKAAVDITESADSALPALNTVVKIPVKKFLTDEIMG